ncbi:four helix bundle protein [Patescibacteria group bacterium]
MKYNFERLEVYQLSIQLIKLSYKIAAKLPRHEDFVLKQQLLRAITSIALNIAEGSGRKKRKEFCRYIRISIGSLQESVAIFKILLDLEEIDQVDFDKVNQIFEKLYFKLVKLEKSIKETAQAV